MLQVYDAVPRPSPRTPRRHELLEGSELHLLVTQGTGNFIARLQSCGSWHHVSVVDQQPCGFRRLFNVLWCLPFGRGQKGPPFGGPIVVIHSTTPYSAGLASGKQDHHFRPIEKGRFPTEATRPAKAQ